MRVLPVLFASLLGLIGTHAAAEPRDGYRYYEIGDVAAKAPGKTQAGLMLVGGGEWPYDAFRWMIERAGNGRIVILRASDSAENQAEFFNNLGGVTGAQTIVFEDRKAASDPAVLDIVRKADGIFLAGGDQSNYVRYWKGTPLNKLLDEHVKNGKPIGGTSAGLAILGAYSYGAMDGGSLVSDDALKNPTGPGLTLVDDFLHMPHLSHVITDSHFAKRDRQGRLIAFLAKLAHDTGRSDLVGIGVDEYTALCIDANGVGKVFSGSGGYAWLFKPQRGAVTYAAGKPLTFRAVPVTGAGTGSVVHLKDFRVERPAFHAVYDATDGTLVRREPGVLAPDPRRTVLVIHGGAGVERATMTPDEEKAARAALDAALRAGHAQLAAGKPALEAVTAAITVLEDDPSFNAGRGAVFTHDGKNALDAAVMDGASLRAGAVAGVERVKNPITAARAVMEKSRHVMMVGAGAEAFAQEQGVTLVEPKYFYTEKRWQQLQKALKEEANGQAHADIETAKHFGTVGAVALDANGKLAAGTSTGGMTNKRYGRVGDSPIIGAGTYANAQCAVSGTGWGEFYIRAVAAYDICSRVQYAGLSIKDAADAVINREIPQAGGDGGAIALASDGSFALPFNTEGMYRGWIGADGVPHVAVYKEEKLAEPVVDED